MRFGCAITSAATANPNHALRPASISGRYLRSRAVLEARLNPKVEPSLAIRSQYGRFFSTLWYIDRAWTVDRINLIFPADETERRPMGGGMEQLPSLL